MDHAARLLYNQHIKGNLQSGSILAAFKLCPVTWLFWMPCGIHRTENDGH